jgi:hypothetical protein
MSEFVLVRSANDSVTRVINLSTITHAAVRADGTLILYFLGRTDSMQLDAEESKTVMNIISKASK